MKIIKSDLKREYAVMLKRFGNKKFCVQDVEKYSILEPRRIGMMLRLMWFYGMLNKHAKDKKRGVIIYTLRGTG